MNKMHEPPRVLTIEDESTVRQSIVTYLSDSGFEVIEAENGRAGLQRLVADEPDVVLCDLRMPELDGLSVLEEAARFRPDVPFIVVSGTGEMRDAIQSLRLGAWDYIMKPIQDMAVIEHSVRKAIERARLIMQNREYGRNLEETNHRLQQSLSRLEEDEIAARRVQFQLLPKSETALSGHRFSYLLCTSTILSGDFVDYFSIDAEHVGFYIADVSGHGVASALVTVFLKSAMNQHLEDFRQRNVRTLLCPADTLSLLNQRIITGTLEKYVTMFYGVIHVPSARLSYCNGGHFPAPIIWDGQTASFLPGRNLPVGLFADAVFENKGLALPASFAIGVFSDGTLDALSDGSLDEKKERLRTLMTDEHFSLSTVVAGLGLVGNNELKDDATVLIVVKGDGHAQG